MVVGFTATVPRTGHFAIKITDVESGVIIGYCWVHVESGKQYRIETVGTDGIVDRKNGTVPG